MKAKEKINMTSVACNLVDVQNSDLHRESSEELRKGETGIEIQSGRCRFHKAVRSDSVNKGGGLRGKVGTMSNAARRRFMGKFASLDYEALAASGVPIWFMTLTTPECFWTQLRLVYLALRRFRDALNYSQGDNGYLGAFVRRELGTKRGMLHYHLVIIGGDMKAFGVADAWARSLRYDGKVRVDVQPCDTPERVSKYLSKYCSKVGYEGKEGPSVGTGNASSEPVPVPTEAASGDAPLSEAHTVGNAYTGGRWWYVWGEETLPWGEVVTILGDEAKAIANRLRRIFRRWRVQKEVQRRSRESGFRALDIMGAASVKRLQKWDRFGEFLRRGGGGFTLLLSPELLGDMLDAACMACAGQES